MLNHDNCTKSNPKLKTECPPRPQAHVASVHPRCHYCANELPEAHITDVCGLSFCDLTCYDNFEDCIPFETFQGGDR